MVSVLRTREVEGETSMGDSQPGLIWRGPVVEAHCLVAVSSPRLPALQRQLQSRQTGYHADMACNLTCLYTGHRRFFFFRVCSSHSRLQVSSRGLAENSNSSDHRASSTAKARRPQCKRGRLIKLVYETCILKLNCDTVNIYECQACCAAFKAGLATHIQTDTV